MVLMACVTVIVVGSFLKGCEENVGAFRYGFEKRYENDRAIWVKPCSPIDSTQNTSDNK
jgi:hypothetical protein